MSGIHFYNFSIYQTENFYHIVYYRNVLLKFLSPYFFSTPQDLPKALHAGLQILDDLLSQDIRVRQVVQVREAFVLDPGDVQAGLVSGDDILVRELPPSSFGILLYIEGFLAFIDVGRVIAVDEVSEVFKLQWVLFQGEVYVGPEIIEPDISGPGIFGGRLVVKKQHICFDPCL